MPPLRKHPRLHPDVYEFPGPPCSITIAVKGRKAIFGPDQDAFTRTAMSTVDMLAGRLRIPLHIALFMPDHVHVCAEASPQASLISFIKSFKALIIKEYHAIGVTGTFWQASFFDHFAREDENLEKLIWYILQNPVRGGLAQNWWEYPYRVSNKYTDDELKKF